MSREHIKKRLEHGKAGEALELGIYSGEELVGSIGFHHIAMENKKASIGYWISEEFQGRGIMTDCVRALIGYGFKMLGLHRIRIQCNVENRRSAAIPERLGFTFEGIAREDEFLYDRFASSRIYSILSHEWNG